MEPDVSRVPCRVDAAALAAFRQVAELNEVAEVGPSFLVDPRGGADVPLLVAPGDGAATAERLPVGTTVEVVFVGVPESPDHHAVRCEDREGFVRTDQLVYRYSENLPTRRSPGGSFRIVSWQSECGGDSCGVENWFVYDDGTLFHVNGLDGLQEGWSTLEIAADDSFLLYDEIATLYLVPPGAIDRSPLGGEVHIYRMGDRSGGPLAEGFSPSLHPSGRWFAVRDKQARVIAHDLTGKELGILYEPDADHTERFGWWGDWPQPVRFTSERAFVVRAADQTWSVSVDLPEALVDARDADRSSGSP